MVMRKQELMPILAELGVQPSRRLGQNFLVDKNMLDAMIRDASPQRDEFVLEIGPGTGVLTQRLIDAGCRLTAVEFDHRLAGYLRQRFADVEHFRLIEGDACKQNYDELMPHQTWRCIANLPYACSSVFIARLLEGRFLPQELWVLLQYEMGRRLAAEVGSADYGALTVQVQLFYDVEIARKVPPGVFYPPPEVDSAYVCLRRKKDEMKREEIELAILLAKTGFSQRRKKLCRLLEKLYSREVIATVFANMGLAEDIRAEKLSPSDWIVLARNFKEV